MGSAPRIPIIGGGYGSMHTALRPERLLRPDEVTVMIADPLPRDQASWPDPEKKEAD